MALEDAAQASPAINPLRALPSLSRRQWAYAASLPVLLMAAFDAWQSWRAPGATQPLRAVALTTFPGIERYPSLSPDGNHVAFMWTGHRQDNADIYVQMIGAGSPVGEALRLTTDAGSEQNPSGRPTVAGSPSSRASLRKTSCCRRVRPT